jgi:hypothetical protein
MGGAEWRRHHGIEVKILGDKPPEALIDGGGAISSALKGWSPLPGGGPDKHRVCSSKQRRETSRARRDPLPPRLW